jgi:hypothetical protein
LLEVTARQFEKSQIKRIALEKHVDWNYSVCETRLVPNNVLIVGFNPGTGKQKEVPLLRAKPEKSFLEWSNKELG